MTPKAQLGYLQIEGEEKGGHEMSRAPKVLIFISLGLTVQRPEEEVKRHTPWAEQTPAVAAVHSWLVGSFHTRIPSIFTPSFLLFLLPR